MTDRLDIDAARAAGEEHERDMRERCPDCGSLPGAPHAWDCPRQLNGAGHALGDCINVGAWLRAAYLRRRAADWPPFADAMGSPVLSRLILQEAQHPTAGATIKRPEVVRPDPPPAGVSSPVTQPRFVTVTKSETRGGSPTPQALDFKSRAAGERPETDDS